MSQWGSEDVRNVYAGMNSKGQHDKAGWLKPVATAAGAAGGFLVGGPAGAMAGAQLGGAAGGLGHDVANGQATAQGVMVDVAGGVSGYQGLDKAMQAKSLIEAFMQNPHQFRLGFATGGPVLSPSMDPNLLQRLLYGSQGAGVPSGPTQTPQGPLGASSDVLGAIPGQVRSVIGNGPDLPVQNPLQTASHPGWEATAAVLAKLLESMPKPANPKNTKAIGAWTPALGVLAGAPGDIAAARRTAANTGITNDNNTRRAEYDKRKAAYDSQYGQLANTLAGNATKPFAPSTNNMGQPTGLDEPMDEATALRVTGDKAWTGMTLRKWNARQKPAANSTSSSTTISPRARRIADAIKSGKMRPTAVSSLPPRDPIRAEVMDVLATEGADLNKMSYDISAETKFWQTQNDSKRTTIRTQLNTLAHTIPYTRNLIQQAKDIIPDFSAQGFNRVTLTAAANLPGPRGVLARKLVAQIGDIGAEVGTLYMGGNSNTDESFRLAGQNIQADWSEEQLMAALDQIEMNTGIRLNAIKDVVVSKPTSDKPIKSIEAY